MKEGFILISFVMFGMILSPIIAYCIHKIISKCINKEYKRQ